MRAPVAILMVASLIPLAALTIAPGLADKAAKARRVPAKRLANEIYTSPDGGFTLKGEGWLLPGARAEELQMASTTRAVRFMDDFGGVYSVVCTSDAPDSLTAEKVSEEYTVNDELRDKRIVTTDRGQELRLVGVYRGGSPIVSRTTEAGKMVERANDLFDAWSLFRHQRTIYRVTAGITRITPATDSVMLERAARKLDVVLSGLTIAAGR